MSDETPKAGVPLDFKNTRRRNINNNKWRDSAERYKMQNPLEAYAAKLLDSKGEPDTPESRSRLLGQINEAIDTALIEALPLKQLDKLETSASEGNVNEDTVEALLMEVGANPSKIINETLTKFQNEYLKGAK